MDVVGGDASRGTRGGDGRAVWSRAHEQGQPGLTMHCHGTQSQCLLTRCVLGAFPMTSLNSARLPFERRGLSSAHSRTLFCCCTVSGFSEGKGLLQAGQVGNSPFRLALAMAVRYLHQVLTRV